MATSVQPQQAHSPTFQISPVVPESSSKNIRSKSIASTGDRGESGAETPRFTSTTYPSNCLQFLKSLPPVSAPTQVNRSESDGEMFEQAKSPLRILVVGAGLGGLATATALKLRGHDVTVLEQAPFLAEVGAGIQIPPNSTKLLRRWGVLDGMQDQLVQPDGITFRRWQTGERIGFTDLSKEFSATYEGHYYVAHRAHLHSALHKRATDLGVKVLLNSKVVSYDSATPSITLEDGGVFVAELVVAADGIKSIGRESVPFTSDSSPRRTGYAAYRATVDVEKLRREVPEAAWILEKPGLNTWIGEKRHVMTYTISSGTSFNMVLSHEDHTDASTWMQLSKEQIAKDMRSEFAGWDSQLCKIINIIDNALKWPLLEAETIDKWVAPSSRLVVLGDAAHAMLPYMSQGAAMAVEDGAALAIALNDAGTADEIKASLLAWEMERKERATMMQEASRVNSMIWHFADGPAQRARDAAMRPEVRGLRFLTSPNQWSDPQTQAWAYGYDAEQAMSKKLESN